MTLRQTIGLLSLLLITFSLSGCEVIADIFRAGFIVGIIAVVLVVLIIIWIIRKIS